jgi:hypothetical protein
MAEEAQQETPVAADAAPTDVEGTPPAEEQVETKTFTQEELDAIVQKRISKLERKLERQKIESDTRRQVETEIQSRQEAPGKPNIDQFNTIEEFTEALTDWKAEQKYHEIKERELKADQENREKANKARMDERQQELLETGERKYDDFEDVVKSDKTEYSRAAYLAILESDQSADIVYHLAKNQDEAKRISNLPAYAQAKEIGKLEDKLASRKPPKASNAPEPVKPIGSGSSPSVDLSTVSMDEYIAQRQKQKPVWMR